MGLLDCSKYDIDDVIEFLKGLLTEDFLVEDERFKVLFHGSAQNGVYHGGFNSGLEDGVGAKMKECCDDVASDLSLVVELIE